MKQNYVLDIDFQSYNSYNSMHFNRLLAHAIGAEEALIYASLISKYYYYEGRDMLDNPDGWFYVTEADLQESTTYKEKVQRKAIKHLVESGLIEYKLMGLPAKRYFRIINDNSNIHNLEEKGLSISKEIYAKTTEANMLKKSKKTDKSSSSQMAELDTQSKNADFSSSAKMAELAPPNGRNLELQNGGTCPSQMAEHTYNNLNLNNHNLNQSSIVNGSESFQQSEKDGRKDDKKQEYKVKSFNEVLNEIDSPLAEMGYKSEADMDSLDEDCRATSSCTIQYDLKEDKNAFKTALRYLMAYSYRMPEYDREMQNFTDAVIDCLTELVSNDRSGKRIFHYYEVIDSLNEIISRDSLFDWLLMFSDKWKAVCREKKQRNDPIKNKKLYMKPFIYDFLKDYKIEETYPELDIPSPNYGNGSAENGSELDNMLEQLMPLY